MSTLLDVRCRGGTQWSPDELRHMLRHQLAAPLHLSLGSYSAEVVHLLRQSQPPLDANLSFGDLLRHPQPPVEVLALVKRFAKRCRADFDHPLPSEVIMFLYFSSIAAALARRRERISDLTSKALRRGVSWFFKQPWVDDEIRKLLRDALDQIGDTGAS